MNYSEVCLSTYRVIARVRLLRYHLAARILALTVAAVFHVLASENISVASTPLAGGAPTYTWNQVAIGGGGYVTGLAFHPTVPGLAYARTDVGGAYRRDPQTGRWRQLLDGLAPTAWNYFGVASVVIDPTDAAGNTLWLAVGKYADQNWAQPALGALLHSRDGGATWITSLDLRIAANSDQAFGECLAMDPRDHRHVVYASRADGLWTTRDDGNTWTVEPAFPRTEKQTWPAMAFAMFDPSVTDALVVGTRANGIWRSQDRGRSWQMLADAPASPHRAVFAPNGDVLVAGDSGLHRFAAHQQVAGTWQRITPPDTHIVQAVEIDPHDDHTVLAVSGGHHGQQVWRSTDDGATWRNVTGKRQPLVPWWPSWHWFSSPSSLVADPHHPGEAWIADWYGVYHTVDIAAVEPVWSNPVEGIESVVCIGGLCCPTGGDVQLFSGIADVGGFDHRDLSKPPPSSIWGNGLPMGLSSTGVDVCERNPALAVRVGRKDWNGPGMGGWTANGGTTWTPFATVPGGGGRVAITADGSAFVWAVSGGGIYQSTDQGEHWTASQPTSDLLGTMGGSDIFVWTQPLVADLVEPATVYAVAHTTLWTSIDGGTTFIRRAALPGGNQVQLRAAPGQAGNLWLALGAGGLWHSPDHGETFVRVTTCAHAELICLGVGKSPAGPPTVFVMGQCTGADATEGLFRSDDQGATWLRIDTPTQRLGDQPNTLAGDRRIFGRVFVGTNGRGLLVGTPP